MIAHIRIRVEGVEERLSPARRNARSCVEDARERAYNGASKTRA